MSEAQPSTLNMLYVIMRLNRWGMYMRWLARGGTDPRPKLIVSWWHKIITRRLLQEHDQQQKQIDTCPVDLEEARETCRCIDALPDHLRDVVIEEYEVGGSAEQKAGAIGIEASVFRRRREKAHLTIHGLFLDAAAGVPLQVETQIRGRPPKRRCAA